MNMNVRLEGMSKNILDKLIELGYFKSKNDAIRVGLVELAIKYNVMPTKEEIEDYYYSIKAKEIVDKIDSDEMKTYNTEEMIKRHPNLKKELKELKRTGK
jgi:Arc/MetJ-type ribon-helix-helix transcriptional regulator